MYQISIISVIIATICRDCTSINRKFAIPFHLKIYGKNVTNKSITRYISTCNNLKLEVIQNTENVKSQKPPLVFIHGSGGGAWIFNEKWMPFFRFCGYNTYSVGLRGSYGTGMPKGDDSKEVKINVHVRDLKNVIEHIFRPSRHYSYKPVLVGHSFGGLVLSKLLEDDSIRSSISGAIWMCALPPSGQSKMALRFLFTRFFHTINILRGFAFGLANKRPALNRLIFYDSSVSDDDIIKYMNRLKLDAQIGINMTDLNLNLPQINKNGTAPWLTWKNNIPHANFKRLVLGSFDDYIVDPPAISELAKYVGVSPSFIKGPGHNIMLGGRWDVGANAILEWMQREFL